MYKLYGRRGSGSHAVQVALEEIGLPFERIWVGTETAEAARFRALNPTGRVPVLILPDGTAMAESAAMLIHLALAHPQSALAPKVGTGRYAAFLQWMVFLSANVYEAVLRMYYPARYSIRGDTDAQGIREQGTADYRTYLGIISEAPAPYVMGTDFSIADAYLYMLASWYPGEKSELYQRLPKLQSLVKLVGARASVAKVDADHAE